LQNENDNIVMNTTTRPSLELLLPIALDITASLTAEDRTRRLVAAVHRALPCDAVVVLRLDGEVLVPVAAQGLAEDVLGRRFPRREHPRLEIICGNREPTRFPADSPLPDPYDGLVRGAPQLDVHSCLGCPLRVDGELVGVLTADSLEPAAFDGVAPAFLEHLAALAAAALRTGDLIEALEQRARHQGMVARDLVQDVLDRRGALLIGQSESMSRLRGEIELIAGSELPVLVTGETGVGKELVVRMLHSRSPRADRPLVYVNCAALPESIVESELFGHAKGAFTGADRPRPGKFRVADGASLFLDEIGELPLPLQPKLLRALQEGEIQPVGTDHPAHVDVRIFAATNRELESEVHAGKFRADLLHRLDVCRIRVPALREHREDIPLLAGQFSDRARRRLGTGPIRFSPEALAILGRAAYPGNVRELENVISRGVLRATARTRSGEAVLVHATDFGDSVESSPALVEPPGGTLPGSGRSLRESVRDYQRAAIREALRRTNGSWAAAAPMLGMHRSNLHHLARRLGLH
jgi:anaerobic nitric oxide reductase transcription regulator